MLRIAHRGLAGLFPENTALAFTEALKYSPDAIELDVQLSADEEVVVYHDEDLLRMEGVSKWLKDCSFRELSSLPNRVIKLSDYFELIKNEKELLTFIELKNSFIIYPGLEEKVYKIIKEYKRQDTSIIYSANHYSVIYFKQLAPELKICFPFDNWIFDYGEYCEKHGVNLTIPYYKAMDKDLIEDFHKHGVKVFPWTVDDP